MKFFARLRSWFTSVTGRRKLESDMDAELRFHVESYAGDLMQAGVPQDEALRRARLEFGSVEWQKEECRASLGLRLWDELCGDLVYGTRMLRQSPGFTAVAVVSLALGIGANTAIFTLARDVLYKTMAVPDSERLRLLSWVQHPKTKVGRASGSFTRSATGEMLGSPFPYPLYLDLRQHNSELEDLVGFKEAHRLTVSAGSEAEAVDGELVSGNYYQVLGVKTIAGRPIIPTDDSPASPAVAIISDSYWSRRFGRSAEALSKIITVNRVPVTIVGVNPPDYKGAKVGGTPDIFLPISLQPQVTPDPTGSLLTNHLFWWVNIIGRLKPGLSATAAQNAAEAEFQRSLRATIPEKPPSEFPGLLLTVGARGLDVTRRNFLGPIYILMAAAGLILLIACVNLANLLLARGAARRREISVRLAMGAGGLRIFRQALTESMLLAFMGGGAGFLLGYASRNVVPSLLEASWRTRAFESNFDWKVFLFALAMTLATGLLFGVAPAIRLNHAGVTNALKETQRMSMSGPRAFFGKALVVVQVGLSVLLLIGAGLFVRSLANLRSAPIGFNPQRLLLFEVYPPRAHYSGVARVALFRQIEERLTALPGVQSATLSSEPLLAHSMDDACVHPTGAPASRDRHDRVWINNVGERFFETLEMPVIAGRSFNWHDNLHGPRVAVLNRSLAQRFFGDAGALGKTVSFCEANGQPSDPIEIVGITADAKYAAIDEPAPATLFVPYLQQSDAETATFEIKTSASTESMTKLIRAAVRAVDRDLPLLEVRTQAQQIDATLSSQRTFASLTSGFGLMALILAAIGIYGIMACHVSHRTNEIGIRMALGAQARSVLAMILREAWLLAASGIVVGVAGALATTRLLTSMLFGIKPNDALTYVAAGLLLLAIALAAGAIPARRAAAIDPCDALRHE